MRDREYGVWYAMVNRCTNPKATAYERYGGRGIEVCALWRDSFLRFLQDMGRRPSDMHTLERRDNNGSYSPENCYWATYAEQARNRKSTRLLELDGEKKCVEDWAGIIGVRSQTLLKRLALGWSTEKTLRTPIRSPHV